MSRIRGATVVRMDARAGDLAAPGVLLPDTTGIDPPVAAFA